MGKKSRWFTPARDFITGSKAETVTTRTSFLTRDTIGKQPMPFCSWETITVAIVWHCLLLRLLMHPWNNLAPTGEHSIPVEGMLWERMRLQSYDFRREETKQDNPELYH